MKWKRPLFVLLAWATTLAVIIPTITPYCGLLFQCGCTYAEGMAQCNVFASEGPRCPWCSHGMVGFYLPFSVILIVSLAAAVLLGVEPWWKPVVAGLLGYIVGALLVGLGSALYWDYPLFLFVSF